MTFFILWYTNIVCHLSLFRLLIRKKCNFDWIDSQNFLRFNFSKNLVFQNMTLFTKFNFLPKMVNKTLENSSWKTTKLWLEWSFNLLRMKNILILYFILTTKMSIWGVFSQVYQIKNQNSKFSELYSISSVLTKKFFHKILFKILSSNL